MNFITESYSFASDDGRVILRTCIDKPSNFDHKAFEYLNLYSDALREFAEERLFLRATDLYKNSIGNNTRFMPLLYSLKCSVTYSDDTYLSCLMSVKLSQASSVLFHVIDSIVFINDQILPPRFLCRKHKKKKVILDADGFPCYVILVDGKPVMQRVGKSSVIK